MKNILISKNSLFSSGSCQGCRIQKCHLFKDCKVRTCCQQEGVDYCFECGKFPFENTGFDENLKKRWLILNKKIRKIGLENYYTEVKEKSRY
ncbi:DUF3795 domain-containing protein [Dysgonomonas sp. Marseille-P4677]|uniref:DUF3795 domain-containing protein n=1 Tax=Dysgonomonas sp. Marseille-P4677 TaxID=2364790 RepID=UPI001F2B6B24|nr:DUF3795 domain-containing protein [Dysgonomonas sp. Marseille-P4677]